MSSARRLVGLSESVLTALLGEPPLNAQGDRLDRQLHALSLFGNAIPLRGLLERGAGPSRLLSRPALKVFDVDPPPVPVVEDYEVEGPGGPLHLRLYGPDAGRVRPGCVFYHGGGFVLGDLESHDSFCRILARRAKCRVVSVDYRRAPEHPFPAAVEDGEAAFRWVYGNAENLGIDRECLAVAGDSAGGTLATVVAQRQIVERRPRPALQLLMYPKTDHRGDYPSRHQPNENLFLTWRAVQWFAEQYLAGFNGDPDRDHRISPLRFQPLEEMPPTILSTAGFDPLRDEGDAYGTRLESHNVTVLRRPYGRLIHGFISIGGVVDRARRATEELCDLLGEQLRRIRGE